MTLVSAQNANFSLLSDVPIEVSENLKNQKNLDEFISKLNSDDEKLLNLLFISESYLKQNQFKEALKYILQAELLAKQIKAENLKAYTSILLADFYNGLELYKKAEEQLEQAISPLSLMKEGSEKQFLEAKFQLEKGLVSLATANENEALINFWKSENRFQSVQNEYVKSEFLSIVYSQLGNYHLGEKQLDSSKYYFDKNLKLLQIEHDVKLELQVKNQLSKFYLQKKQTDSALFYAAEIPALLPKTDDLRLKKEVFHNLAQIYYSVKDVENYKKFNQKYLGLNDSIYKLDKETRVLLAKRADVPAASEPYSSRLLWIMIALGIALILLVLIYAHHLKVKKEYAHFQKIMKSINERENLRLTEAPSISPTQAYAISEKTEQVILEKLKRFEDSEKYISPKVSLHYLAKQLDTNTKYLSEIINKHKGQNFNNYINELRIHYILRKLKAEPKYQNYKVISLAEECGFNSRNTFTLAFKSTLGMSPAKFIGFMKKESYVEDL